MLLITPAFEEDSEIKMKYFCDIVLTFAEGFLWCSDVGGRRGRRWTKQRLLIDFARCTTSTIASRRFREENRDGHDYMATMTKVKSGLLFVVKSASQVPVSESSND